MFDGPKIDLHWDNFIPWEHYEGALTLLWQVIGHATAAEYPQSTLNSTPPWERYEGALTLQWQTLLCIQQLQNILTVPSFRSWFSVSQVFHIATAYPTSIHIFVPVRVVLNMHSDIFVSWMACVQTWLRHLEIRKSGSEIRDQVRESIWILAVEFCKNPWILAI